MQPTADPRICLSTLHSIFAGKRLEIGYQMSGEWVDEEENDACRKRPEKIFLRWRLISDTRQAKMLNTHVNPTPGAATGDGAPRERCLL
ncbi:hypothetical protein EVAR_97890_1 [Eumeta japonica]|uniref:Uncharacterized protein n=1 Tax=Eumeta variegata TaxID=151549 RepID=A0A4C1WER9_EUMVA|nr:hypothetical protein EVAR_97890_1 [Eumeta japonica]